jgi:hypothetical protein
MENRMADGTGNQTFTRDEIEAKLDAGDIRNKVNEIIREKKSGAAGFARADAQEFVDWMIGEIFETEVSGDEDEENEEGEENFGGESVESD